MIDYPDKLDTIFDKLNYFKIKPIIVGGYIRDKLLNLNSKDIDIELYGVDSFESLEKILEEFGDVNSVGKSFGVCKLSFGSLDIDFSLPRIDSKTSQGHRGFDVQTDKSLDFKTATSRRDFTINAIGFDVIEKKLLDPYNGLLDLEKKILRAVDLNKFDEDPLRVLRAVQFSARLAFKLEKRLYLQCKTMIESDILSQLAKERIFLEIEKLLMKSMKPSIGFYLLKELGAFNYFKGLETLDEDLFKRTMLALDMGSKNTTILLALLTSFLSEVQANAILIQLTGKKSLIENVLNILRNKNHFNIDNFKDFNIYQLATRVDVSLYVKFLDAYYLGEKSKEIEILTQKAQRLNVFKKPLKPFIEGRELIKLGLSPSPKFKIILDEIYTAQMYGKFCTYKDALTWTEQKYKLL